MISTATAKLVLQSLPRTWSSPAALASALIGAYAAYEVVLFAFTPFLGGTGAFTLTIIARLGLLNVMWMIALVAVWQIFRVLSHGERKLAT